MILLYPNAFIGMLVYPRVTLTMLYLFLALRIWHIRGYLHFRGYNRAVAAESCSKLLLISIVVVSFVSSLSMMGVTQRLGVLRKFIPKRL